MFIQPTTIFLDTADPWEGKLLSHAEFKKRLEFSFNSFPDMHFEITSAIPGENHVAITWILTGTNLGEISQFPATNKSIKTNGITIYHFKENLISGHTQVFDRLTVMKQLGVLSKLNYSLKNRIMNYAKLAFTDAVKKLQEQNGSRNNYERMERYTSKEGLTPNEINMIEERDSFYMASFGENEFPYIQHRGGSKGFLKVLDPKTLAFIDFTGNKQYISVGNIKTNNKVSLILVDYPRKARLKIYAEAEVLSLSESPEMMKKLKLEGYKYRPERVMVFHIKAFDWNCPQHIKPRYTEEEIERAFALQKV